MSLNPCVVSFEMLLKTCTTYVLTLPYFEFKSQRRKQGARREEGRRERWQLPTTFPAVSKSPFRAAFHHYIPSSPTYSKQRSQQWTLRPHLSPRPPFPAVGVHCSHRIPVEIPPLFPDIPPHRFDIGRHLMIGMV